LFHAERVALEYSPGDLAASSQQAPWEAISSIIDPKQLGKTLKLKGREHRNGLAVEHYAGHYGDTTTALDWMPALQLPARIAKTSKAGVEALVLVQCSPLLSAAVQPISPAALAGYRHLDYSDLGDMESDPLVQRILSLSGEKHLH
jgi:hypothetical protein